MSNPIDQNLSEKTINSWTCYDLSLFHIVNTTDILALQRCFDALKCAIRNI